MKTQKIDTACVNSGLTQEQAKRLLMVAECLLTVMKNTPKENIMTIGVLETPDGPEMRHIPFLDSHTFRYLTEITDETRTILEIFPRKVLAASQPYL